MIYYRDQGTGASVADCISLSCSRALYLECMDRNCCGVDVIMDSGRRRQRETEAERQQDRNIEWWRTGVLLVFLISAKGHVNIRLFLPIKAYEIVFLPPNTQGHLLSPPPLRTPAPAPWLSTLSAAAESWFSGSYYSRAVGGILLWCPTRGLQLDTEPRNWFTQGCPSLSLHYSLCVWLRVHLWVSDQLPITLAVEFSSYPQVCRYFWQL